MPGHGGVAYGALRVITGPVVKLRVGGRGAVGVAAAGGPPGK